MAGDFVEELYNKYFGLKDYVETDNCPLTPSEIDRRFFDEAGIPNDRLQGKVNELNNAVRNAGFHDTQFEIYVVGGVAAQRPKKDYHGDLDLYVHIPSQKEATIKFDEEDNLAMGLIRKINPSIPDEEGRKKDGYTDVMVSKYPPMGQLPFFPGEQGVVYNATRGKWVLIKGK